MTGTPTILVTGGAGFIGSNFVRRVVRLGYAVVNIDKLTYAGNLDNLASLGVDAGHRFVHGDIGDRELVARLLAEHRPRYIVNFAAESHVDRSIDDPTEFVRTNVVGAFQLLQGTLAHWKQLPEAEAGSLRFLQVSTDEVFGSLGASGHFSESSAYAPNSPYAASKASADHLTRAMHATYGLPTLVSNCSNNYGPFQFPEKLIPLTVLNALEGKPLPVYGDGGHVRDWLYVEDHCAALVRMLERAQPGQAFVVGGRSEKTNIEVVRTVCGLLDSIVPPSANANLAGRSSRLASYADLITFVRDRSGHDRRYAVDPSRIEGRLGWSAAHGFVDGLEHTVRWYVANRAWCDEVTRTRYGRERLGLRGSA